MSKLYRFGHGRLSKIAVGALVISFVLLFIGLGLVQTVNAIPAARGFGTSQYGWFGPPTVAPSGTPTLTPTFTPTSTGLLGDMNGDCRVDILDIMYVAGRWNTKVGDPDYDAKADLNNDGHINVLDIMTVSGQWMETCEGSRISDSAHGRLAVESRPGNFLVYLPIIRLRPMATAMRQVTRLKGDHQTQIMTTRHDLDITEVAHRMFNRWRQENYFKYMRQDFAIDALVQYGEEEADPDREIPNPAWTDADKKLKTAKKKLRRLEADYGAAAADNPEKQRPTMRGFKIAHVKELGVPLREQRQRVDQFQQDRDALPKRTTVGQLAVDQRPVRLPERRKRLSDGLKMLAYQVESDLVRAITLHYKRVDDEGRTLIAAAMRSGGDIDLAEGELRITLAPQSSPHRSRVIAELCRVLDQTETRFPGTDLRMRFGVRGVDPGADCAT